MRKKINYFMLFFSFIIFLISLFSSMPVNSNKIFQQINNEKLIQTKQENKILLKSKIQKIKNVSRGKTLDSYIFLNENDIFDLEINLNYSKKNELEISWKFINLVSLSNMKIDVTNITFTEKNNKFEDIIVPEEQCNLEGSFIIQNLKQNIDYSIIAHFVLKENFVKTKIDYINNIYYQLPVFNTNNYKKDNKYEAIIALLIIVFLLMILLFLAILLLYLKKDKNKIKNIEEEYFNVNQ